MATAAHPPPPAPSPDESGGTGGGNAASTSSASPSRPRHPSHPPIGRRGNQTFGQKMQRVRRAYARGDVAASRDAHREGVSTHDERRLGGMADYVKSIVYGGLDGIVTTFAVVTAAKGAERTEGFDVAQTILILGFANLFADGFSMGFGEYVSMSAEIDQARAERAREEWEVEQMLDMEQQEMIDLYVGRGFPQEDAAQLVAIISRDKDRFVDVMMVDELGFSRDLFRDPSIPVKSGVTMFIAFVLFGAVPLIAYIPQNDTPAAFGAACGATAATLFALGAVRGKLTSRPWWRCGVVMVGNGGVAAGVSYFVGWLVGRIVE